MTTFVYVIRAQESGRIKIGFAKDPKRRLAELQVGNPEYLDLVGAVPGDRYMESRIHAELQGSRLAGEWFEPTDHVIGVVGRLLGWGSHAATGRIGQEGCRFEGAAGGVGAMTDEEWAAEVVSKFPPLSPSRRNRISLILRSQRIDDQVIPLKPLSPTRRTKLQPHKVADNRPLAV